jgi:hypothetical protein
MSFRDRWYFCQFTSSDLDSMLNKNSSGRSRGSYRLHRSVVPLVAPLWPPVRLNELPISTGDQPLIQHWRFRPPLEPQPALTPTVSSAIRV